MVITPPVMVLLMPQLFGFGLPSIRRRSQIAPLHDPTPGIPGLADVAISTHSQLLSGRNNVPGIAMFQFGAEDPVMQLVASS